VSILSELLNSKICASVGSLSDGYWAVKLGDGITSIRAEAMVESEETAYLWLEEMVLEFYPESDWARIRRGTDVLRAPDLPGAEGLSSARADEDTYD